MVSSFFVLYTLAFLQKESQKKYYVILGQVSRITLQSITYYFAKYHVMLSLLYFLVFFISLLDLSFFIAKKDTYLIFYL